MNHRVKVALSAAAIPIVLLFGLSTIFYRPWESATQRAYRLCYRCSDLEPDEVDDLIDANIHSTLTREQSMALFQDQFDDEADAEFCASCVEAVLDAADGMNRL